jgi:hypothetical protein
MRLAWLALQKSKVELISVADQLGENGLMELVRQIGQSGDCVNRCAKSWSARNAG